MKELVELLEKVGNNIKYEMKVALPAKVIKFNSSNYSVDVQPLPRISTQKGFIKAPIIKHVPLMTFNTKIFAIHVPISEGDIVQLLVNDLDIDTVVDSPDIYIPDSNRMHMLEDCVALPMYVTKNTPIENAGEDLRIINKNKDVEIMITANGTVSIKGSDINLGAEAIEQAVLGNKLKDYLDQIMTTIKGHTHIVSNGTASASSQLSTLSGPEEILSDVVRIK